MEQRGETGATIEIGMLITGGPKPDDLDLLVGALASAGFSVQEIRSSITMGGQRRRYRLAPAEIFEVIIVSVATGTVATIAETCTKAFIDWARERFKKNKHQKFAVIVGPDNRPLSRVVLKDATGPPDVKAVTDWPDPPHVGRGG
jgi:hypothetical protein